MMDAPVSARANFPFSFLKDAQVLRPGSNASLAQHREAAAAALDAMYAVAQEQLQKRADASKGWLHFGGVIDASQEKQHLDSLFAKAKTSLEQGEVAGPFNLLDRLDLNAEEKRIAAELKSDHLMGELDGLGQEEDHASRSQGLALMARERLLKSADLPQSAEYLAQSLAKDSYAAKSAGEILDMIHGRGDLGLKLDYLLPHLIQEVTKPSMVAGMMVVPFAGTASEMAGLRVAKWIWQGEQLGAASRLGASLFKVVGEAGAFTLLHNTVNSATQDPAKVWANTKAEMASNLLMFGAMGLAHGVWEGTTMRMAQGRMNVAWLPKLGEAGSGLSKTGRWLSGVADHGSAILAMQGSGAASRWMGFSLGNAQAFAGNFIDAAIQHTQARIGGGIIRGMTGGRLEVALDEFRAKIAPASLRVGGLKSVPKWRPAKSADEPKSMVQGPRGQNPLLVSLSAALGGAVTFLAPELAFAQSGSSSGVQSSNTIAVEIGAPAVLLGLAALGVRKWWKQNYAPKKWLGKIEALRAKIPKAEPQELHEQLAQVSKYLSECRACTRVRDKETAEAGLHFLAAALPHLEAKDRLTALRHVKEVLVEGGGWATPLTPLALKILRDNARLLDSPDLSKLAQEFVERGLVRRDPDEFFNTVISLFTLMNRELNENLSIQTYIDAAQMLIRVFKNPERQETWNNYLYLTWTEYHTLKEIPRFAEILRNEAIGDITKRWDMVNQWINGLEGVVPGNAKPFTRYSNKYFRKRKMEILKKDFDNAEILEALWRRGKIFNSIEDIFHFVRKMGVFFGKEEVKDDTSLRLGERVGQFAWYTEGTSSNDWMAELYITPKNPNNSITKLEERVATHLCHIAEVLPHLGAKDRLLALRQVKEVLMEGGGWAMPLTPLALKVLKNNAKLLDSSDLSELVKSFSEKGLLRRNSDEFFNSVIALFTLINGDLNENLSTQVYIDAAERIISVLKRRQEDWNNYLHLTRTEYAVLKELPRFAEILRNKELGDMTERWEMVDKLINDMQGIGIVPGNTKTFTKREKKMEIVEKDFDDAEIVEELRRRGKIFHPIEYIFHFGDQMGVFFGKKSTSNNDWMVDLYIAPNNPNNPITKLEERVAELRARASKQP